MKSSFVIVITGIPQSGKTTLSRNLSAGFSKINSNTLLMSWTAKKSFQLQNNQWKKLQTVWKPTLLQEFQKTYDFIIIDGGAVLSEDLKLALEQAAAILISAPSNEDDLQKTSHFLNKLYAFIPRDLVYAILTYYD